MSDAFGRFKTNYSGDVIFDGEGLVDALNQYEGWSNDNNTWGLQKDASGNLTLHFQTQQGGTFYPSVDLHEIVGIDCIDSDGSSFVKPWDEATDEEIDASEWVTEPVNLSQISEKVSPFIKSGWIEISCNCEDTDYFASGRLKIYASGRVERSILVQGNPEESRDESEVFDPAKPRDIAVNCPAKAGAC